MRFGVNKCKCGHRELLHTLVGDKLVCDGEALPCPCVKQYFEPVVEINPILEKTLEEIGEIVQDN
jgi:hypothetical protein